MSSELPTNPSYIHAFIGDGVLGGLSLAGLVNEQGKAYADYCENCQLRKDIGLEKRRGYGTKTTGNSGYGLYEYSYLDSTGNYQKSLYTVSDTLYKLNQGTLNITYSGSFDNGVVKIKPSSATSTIHLYLIANNVTVLDSDLGKGFEETSTVTLSTLATAISAITGFSATVTGNSNSPAALLDITPHLSIPKGQTKTIKFYYLSAVNTPMSNPFPGLSSRKGTANINNVQAVNHRNVLVLTDGDYPKIYDGQNLYLAGLPNPNDLSEAPGVLPYTSIGTVIKYTNNLDGTYTLNIDSTTWLATNFGVDQYISIGSILQDNIWQITSYDNSSSSLILTQIKGTYIPVAGDLVYWQGFKDEYRYIYVYNYIDNQGNTTQSNPSNQLSVSYNYETGTLNIPNITQSTGYNTNCAIASSNQTVSVSSGTIVLNCNDGSGGSHSLKVGDSCLLYNRNTSAFETYPVSAISSSSITLTVTSPTVTITVNSGDAFSNQLSISLYRSIGTSNIFQLVSSFVNNSYISSIFYNDIVLDEKLGAFFAYSISTTGSIYSQGPPPKADVCCVYQSHLVLGKGYNIYWSDEINNGITTSSMSFPPSYFEPVFIQSGDIIKGLAVSNTRLCIFGRKSIKALDGSFDDNSFRIFSVTDSIGLTSASSITSIGQFLYFLADSGIYSIFDGNLASTNQNYNSVDGNAPVAETIHINSFFYNIDKNASDYYRLERAVGVNDTLNQRLLMFIPLEPNTPNDFCSNSIVIVYEYWKNQWFFWKSMNMAGGAVFTSDNELWFSERQAGASLRTNINKVHTLFTDEAFWDHHLAIKWVYEAKWERLAKQVNFNSSSLGTWKKIVKLRIYQVTNQTEPFTPYTTLTAKVYKDYIKGFISTDATYTFGSSGQPWGFRWGDVPIGDWLDPFVTQHLMTDKIEAIKLRFENETPGANVNFTGYELEWSDAYDAKLKA